MKIKEDMFINFFLGRRGLDNLIEDCLCGLEGGVTGYSEPVNNGVFDKEFMKKWILINEGDNDFDYELGRLGYQYLIGHTYLIAWRLLDDIEKSGKSDEVINNIKTSLTNIV